jgi:hypothetical protein
MIDIANSEVEDCRQNVPKQKMKVKSRPKPPVKKAGWS